MLLWGTAHSRSSLHIGSVISCIVFFFFHLLLYYVLDSVPETHKHEAIKGKISHKTVFLNFTGYVGLASSAGNSYCNGYTDHEESENKKRRNKLGGVACQKSKSVDSVLHHCGPVTGLGVPWGFSSD